MLESDEWGNDFLWKMAKHVQQATTPHNSFPSATVSLLCLLMERMTHVSVLSHELLNVFANHEEWNDQAMHVAMICFGAW